MHTSTMLASCTRPSAMGSPSWCASKAPTSTASSAPTSRPRPRWTRSSAMKMRRRWALVLALALPCTGGAALAADYPTRPFKIVVPYAPGGGADTVARIVARRVSENTGYNIVVENKGGAGAILGIEQVAKSKPDAMNYGSTGRGCSQPPRRRAVQQQGRHQDDSRALSRHRAGRRRSFRWAAHGGVQRSDQRPAAHQVGQAARPRRDQPGTLARGARRADRGRERLSWFRGAGLARHPGARQDAARGDQEA